MDDNFSKTKNYLSFNLLYFSRYYLTIIYLNIPGETVMHEQGISHSETHNIVFYNVIIRYSV